MGCGAVAGWGVLKGRGAVDLRSWGRRATVAPAPCGDWDWEGTKGFFFFFLENPRAALRVKEVTTQHENPVEASRETGTPR